MAPRCALSLVVLLSLVAGCSREAPPAPTPPPTPVDVVQVLQRDVPVYIEAIGQTRGDEEIEVRARVEGILESLHFTEGSMVRRGQLLYRIDPREYQAQLDQARGQFAQAQADLARYDQDVARYKPLADQNAIPRQMLDTAVAQANAGRANVEAARAVVTQAELELGYTRVFSPTDGIVGKTEISIGNLVGRGQSTLLTQISKIDPIRLRVSISEREYLQVARRREEFVKASTAAGGAHPFEMLLSDGSVHPHGGNLAFTDRLVDPSTGTLLIDISFPNPERLVRPGQYGRARVAVDFRRNALLVPQKAVSALQSVDSVAVVTADNKVDVRQVTTGPRVGTLWVIETGLKPDDRVIVEGLQKVRPGMVVAPNVVPVPDAAPTPRTPAPGGLGGA